ncbi:uncharacterized protein LOC123549192 [Mercenaria mercenaria]|uniref:uncharacterized protein LOC123549192 n=1 Tax=Mercenaria mercenaria TaxID=6596 RepID=UPI00234E7B63|nr:uncharacterized protein LOC123549192 [Mercenaria mercenaria]
MSSKEDENFSLWINSTLDTFGFRPEIISFRSYWYDKLAENMNLKLEELSPFRFSLVGSAGEGVRLGKSDTDILSVFKNTVCSDNPRINVHLNILKTDYSGTAPGYTKIVLINKSSSDIRHPFHFDTMYKSTEGHPYIPCALEYFAGKSEINGPAFSSAFPYESYLFSGTDLVFSFYFTGKEHLSEWAKRSRFYAWPQHTVLNEISKMEGYIVPVGDKQSDLKCLEWRICYTTAEKKLVQHLNDAQKKLYILLKMVCKTILQPICKAITSYIVKNVVFWVAERMPELQCSVNCLMNLLQKALYFIKYCLENNHLPNYMIPGRNLLRGGVSGREKRQAIDLLSQLMKEGGAIVVRIPKLYQCMFHMVHSPERGSRYGIWRDEVEKQTMKFLVLCQKEYSRRWVPMPILSFLQVLKNMNYMKALKYFMLVVPEFPNMIVQGKFVELQYLFLARVEATMLL